MNQKPTFLKRAKLLQIFDFCFLLRLALYHETDFSKKSHFSEKVCFFDKKGPKPTFSHLIPEKKKRKMTFGFFEKNDFFGAFSSRKKSSEKVKWLFMTKKVIFLFFSKPSYTTRQNKTCFSRKMTFSCFSRKVRIVV